MSKVDTVFGLIPGPLIQEWGQSAVFVRVGASAYDPNTGVVAKSETRIPVKIVITKLDIKESGGLYQTNDVKILIDPGQIGNTYINTDDYFEVPKNDDAAPLVDWKNSALICTSATGTYSPANVTNTVGEDFCTSTDYTTPSWDAGTTDWDNADFQPRIAAARPEVMKVIEPRTYRGDNPVFFVVIARPQ